MSLTRTIDVLALMRRCADVVTEIPPEASVAAAKERRERIRQGQAGQKEDGFIALDVTTRADVYQGPHPESRLMREDDDLGDGEDGKLSNTRLKGLELTKACRFLRIHFCKGTDSSGEESEEKGSSYSEGCHARNDQ